MVAACVAEKVTLNYAKLIKRTRLRFCFVSDINGEC
jgi:hypothetical protein